MAICTDCATAGDLNRKAQDRGGPFPAVHPTDCGCPCRHYPAKEWEDYFSAPRPSTEESPSKS